MDEHINLARGLLNEQFPIIGGFQNCLLSQTHGFTPQERDPFHGWETIGVCPVLLEKKSLYMRVNWESSDFCETFPVWPQNSW